MRSSLLVSLIFAICSSSLALGVEPLRPLRGIFIRDPEAPRPLLRRSPDRAEEEQAKARDAKTASEKAKSAPSPATNRASATANKSPAPKAPSVVNSSARGNPVPSVASRKPIAPPPARIATNPIVPAAPKVVEPAAATPMAAKPVAPAISPIASVPPVTLPSPEVENAFRLYSVMVHKPAESGWKALFDGKSLDGWKSAEFGGDGQIEVVDGQIILHAGDDMTGITYQGKVPKMNYVLEVEAQRLEGLDFFAGTTFPIGDSFATLIPGGWSGGVFGLSSINHADASENETTKHKTFDDKRWYTFRIQVSEGRVQVWIDDKQEIDLYTAEKKLTTRGEVESCKPLGIATWRTKSAIRSIRLRELTKDEITAATVK